MDTKTREKLKQFFLIYKDIFDTRKLDGEEDIAASQQALELSLTVTPLSAAELKEFKKALALYSVNGPPFLE